MDSLESAHGQMEVTEQKLERDSMSSAEDIKTENDKRNPRATTSKRSRSVRTSPATKDHSNVAKKQSHACQVMLAGVSVLLATTLVVLLFLLTDDVAALNSNDSKQKDREKSTDTPVSVGDCLPTILASIGDFICDDEANVNDCGYDGGDCCMQNVNTAFCVECKCRIAGMCFCFKKHLRLLSHSII